MEYLVSRLGVFFRFKKAEKITGYFFLSKNKLLNKNIFLLVILAFCLYVWSSLGTAPAILWLIFLLFLSYRWDAKIILGMALFALVLCPMFLVAGNEAKAEQMAVFAYFFLAMTVGLEIVENIEERFGKKKYAGEARRGGVDPGEGNTHIWGRPRRGGLPLHNNEQIEAIKLKAKNIFRLTWSKVIVLDKSVWIFSGLAILLLWQMLLPGYVLTLDMMFTPEFKMVFNQGAIYNMLPLILILKFLNIFLVGWVLQKVLIFSLFFIIGYFAYKYIPLKNESARYFAAIFYLVNPFVYERFLAGHWALLFGYAFLPALVHSILEFSKEPSFRKSLWIFGWLFAINSFTLHIFAMSVFLSSAVFGFDLLKKFIRKHDDKLKRVLKYLISSGAIFIVASSFWIIPLLFLKGQSMIGIFDQSHFEAFSTASDKNIGTFANVLSLYGFWGEKMIWKDYFLWPKDHFGFWMTIEVVLAIFIIAGVFSSFRKDKKLAVIFLSMAIFAVIFSCGLGQTIFYPVNHWLFDNISFWSGFRDTQKFSAFLALAYAYFGGLGIVSIVRMMTNSKKYRVGVANYCMRALFAKRKRIAISFMIIPFLWTYPMLGGFARQLQPVWYPESWNSINALFRSKNIAKNGEKVLFLPWHEYFSLKFNRMIITQNPASQFFDGQIVQSGNMDMGDKKFQVRSKNNKLIEERIIENKENLSNDQIIDSLAKDGFHYIIYSNDLGSRDEFRYTFLESTRLRPILISKDLTLYEILLN